MYAIYDKKEKTFLYLTATASNFEDWPEVFFSFSTYGNAIWVTKKRENAEEILSKSPDYLDGMGDSCNPKMFVDPTSKENKKRFKIVKLNPEIVD